MVKPYSSTIRLVALHYHRAGTAWYFSSVQVAALLVVLVRANTKEAHCSVPQ